MEEFKVGEYIIYVNGDRYELGRIKKLTEDGAFICYHEGETAAKTPYDLIHKLVNGFTIKETTIGGETFKAQGQEYIFNKIRAELIQSIQNGTIKIESGTDMLFRIIELYKAESEDKE